MKNSTGNISILDGKLAKGMARIAILFICCLSFNLASGQEICNNLIDDDLDGLIDCVDTVDCKPVLDSIIMSNTNPCVNDTVAYTVVTGDAIDNYQWAAPPTHTIVESGSSLYFGPLSTIHVVSGFAVGDICVYGFSPSGCDSDLICRTVNVSIPPGSPSSIQRK